ncbi:hypothetical protein Ahy_B01g054566 [Arachis hypogaea]|uniref:Putative plant transposon protein domain-containing protein n=1 Tax=Arachis hypogaea TaxID=3818 RepID=A0A445AU65_ARAHY|nr:hypothetical protein Ahy_B01g054566 [Arachis hypogaea]
MITEEAIGDALLCHHRPDETCAYRQAEVAILSITVDYEVLKRVIATPDAPWVMDSNNKKSKGMRFAYMTREAKTWQQIFAHYVFPNTHFLEIPMDMLVLIGHVMEGKEINFSRLVRHSMWRAHIRGLLSFPTLVTNMIELAGVPWEDDDVTPPPPDDDDKENTIPWGGWVHEKPPPKRLAGSPSTSAAAASLPPPPPVPEPTYLLVQHLLRFIERFKRHGIELPPLPDSPASDEQDQEEELAKEPIHQDAPSETQTTTETDFPSVIK